MAFQIDIRAAKDSKVVDVYLYGNISSWDDKGIQSANVSKQFAELEKKYTGCKLHINSNGGEVSEGIAIHTVLCNTKMELEIIVDGVAASMAAILVQVPNAKRYMSKYSKMMLHIPSGYASGTSEDMRDYAKMLDDFESSLRQIVSDRTGLDDIAVKDKWFNGKDHWLSPTQALAEKLIDGIVEGNVRKEPKDLVDAQAIYNFYQEQISNLENTMDYKNIIAKLGLKADSTEAEIMDFVGNLSAENATLKTQLSGLQAKVTGLEQAAADAQKQQITDMITAAVTSKKITEAQRTTYQALAEKDFDNTKAILDSLTAYKPLTGVPDGTEPLQGIPEDRKSWTFTDWQRQDGKGLQNLKASHPESFKVLYKNSFGKEPQ